MTTWHDLPLLLTLGEAAELLRVSERTVRRMIQDGRLEASKPAKGYLIPRENVAELTGASMRTKQLIPRSVLRRLLQQTIDTYDTKRTAGMDPEAAAGVAVEEIIDIAEVTPSEELAGRKSRHD